MAVLDLEGYIGSGLSEKQFMTGIQGHKADTLFFYKDTIKNYREQMFIIEGLQGYEGKAVIGSTVNYIGVGIYTAAANRDINQVPVMVKAWNLKDIASGKDFWHNVRQMSHGTDLGYVGYKFYKSLNGQ